jgi:hypothetical protein
MRHTEPAGERRRRKLRFELLDLADGAAQAEVTILLNNRQACGIVTAVLEAAQSLDEDWHDVPFGYCTNDPAHTCRFLTSVFSSAAASRKL